MFTDSNKNLATNQKFQKVTKKPNALILMPFATIKSFQYPLLSLAKILHRNNVNVTVVHCQQAMKDGCIAMQAHNLDLDSSAAEKKAFCDKCYSASQAASKLYPWKTQWLKNTKQIKNKNQKAFIIPKNKLKNLSAYEIFLNQKTHKSLNKKAKQAWQFRTKSLQKIGPQLWKILNQEKYDFVISYNSLYGINNLLNILARKIGITPFCLHEGYHTQRPNQFILQKDNMVENLKNINLLARKKIKKCILNINNIKSHINGLIKGTRPWHYSEPIKNINLQKSNFKTPKVLVTLSSNDEVYSAQKLGFYRINKGVFKNQITWLKWVLELAKKFPNTKFVIRPHPRIYPNKRSPVLSPFAEILEKIRDDVKAENIYWPKYDKQGSAWAHLKDTTLVLNGWSSIGDVFAFFGIPVICFFPDYSANLGFFEITAKSLDSYENKIKRILQSKNRMSNKKVLRWLSFLLSYNTFEINWEAPFWIKYLRKIFPKKSRDKYDLTNFTRFSKIIANDHKILKIIKNQINAN